MVKKRTIQQKSEDESKGAFLTLFKDWIVNPLDNDFGFDFEVRLTHPLDEKTDSVSEISFYFQNKSSIHSSDEKAVEDLSIDDWELYLGQRVPVLIGKYDIPNKIFYWEIAQNYLWDFIEKVDPNWKSQKTKRIVFHKKVESLDEIKTAIIDSQKRITRYHSLNLGIGEGIKIDREDLAPLKNKKNKFLDEYKAITLLEAYYAWRNGDREAAGQSLRDVYSSPKNDERKIRAIIGLIYGLNITDLDQNKKIVELANEAIQLSDTLKIGYLKDFITILRDQALLFTVIKKMSEIQIGLKIQETQGERIFSFFYSQDLTQLNEFRANIIKEINDSLKNLLKQKEIYYYIASLPILLDIFTIQINQFAWFDRRIIEEEKVGRKHFIEQCEFVLENLSDIDLKKTLLRSLAYYFYWNQVQQKAVDYMSKAIDLGKEDPDNPFVERNSKLLELMKSKPYPYAVSEQQKDINEMTTKEYQDMTEKLLIAQGINLENDDQLTSSIKMALRDMNPEEKFRHCENIHIVYLNTSPVGMSIRLPSMGTKLVWCKYCKTCSEGFNLDLIFNSFVEENCKGCKKHSPREKDWECKVNFVREQAKEPQLKKVIDNLRND